MERPFRAQELVGASKPSALRWAGMGCPFGAIIKVKKTGGNEH